MLAAYSSIYYTVQCTYSVYFFPINAYLILFTAYFSLLLSTIHAPFKQYLPSPTLSLLYSKYSAPSISYPISPTHSTQHQSPTLSLLLTVLSTLHLLPYLSYSQYSAPSISYPIPPTLHIPSPILSLLLCTFHLLSFPSYSAPYISYPILPTLHLPSPILSLILSTFHFLSYPSYCTKQ